MTDEAETTERKARESGDEPSTKEELHQSPDGDGDDKSPRAANESETTTHAEISNYEIVSHYFDEAAERLGMPEDLVPVLKTSYREVQVQIPVRLSDG
jgi:hypothetical protein